MHKYRVLQLYFFQFESGNIRLGECKQESQDSRANAIYICPPPPFPHPFLFVTVSAFYSIHRVADSVIITRMKKVKNISGHARGQLCLIAICDFIKLCVHRHVRLHLNTPLLLPFPGLEMVDDRIPRRAAL